MTTSLQAVLRELREQQEKKRPEVEAALRCTYYRGIDEARWASDEVVSDVQDHVFRRYERVLDHYVPWVMNAFDLAGKEIVEVGCGTGSSTAAFSPFCKHVHAYEIAEPSILAADARMKILGLSNVSITPCEAQTAWELIKSRHDSGVAAILLFAVLEHMTVEERLASIRQSWELLSPGGVLIVAETPNRLTYQDYHTSWLPFFHMLPPDLAVRYYNRTPRIGFKAAIDAEFARGGIDAAQLALVRWGNGVSYHEFELALGSELNDLLIADGDSVEMRNLYPMTTTEALLRQFFTEAHVNRPIAFANQIFNLIFQKQ